MILWTIQPEEVYQEIMEDGVYHCDFKRSVMYDWKEAYDWLVKEMKKRIGPPPANVSYPVWAWYQWRAEKKKPDLRSERWGYGSKGDKYVRLEIDIPDEAVLLHDFDAWTIILNEGLLSETEAEDNLLEKQYAALDESGKRRMKYKNWQRVFDISPLRNEWIVRGDSIQATFWELRKDQIQKVQFFVAAS